MRHRYGYLDPELIRQLLSEMGLRRLFNHLLLQTGGDVEEAMDWMRALQERGLIEVVGRSEALGRPLLYGTAPVFLELLGLRDLADLPRAEELTIALQPHRAVPEGEDDAAAYVEAES